MYHEYSYFHVSSNLTGDNSSLDNMLITPTLLVADFKDIYSYGPFYV